MMPVSWVKYVTEGTNSGSGIFFRSTSSLPLMNRKYSTDIEPLLMAVYELLQESGIFVFATQHPCFVTLTEKYMTPHSYYDIAIEGQPKEQIYYPSAAPRPVS